MNLNREQVRAMQQAIYASEKWALRVGALKYRRLLAGIQMLLIELDIELEKQERAARIKSHAEAKSA